ncbi:hypothetical protein [Streptomyces sp. NPDC045470]|uniref:hypothetical protein n=1 Tax=unclassified Streptomyces TaxID=2593676 RepID=UPI0033CA3C13
MAQMKRKLFLLLGTASLSAVSVLGLGTAQAGAAPTAGSGETEVGIRAAKFYLFKDDNRQNGYYPFRKSDGNLANNKWIGGAHAGRTINNGASSMNNNTDRWVDVYDGAEDGHGCGGQKYSARPHSDDDDFTNNDFDNKASCVQFR